MSNATVTRSPLLRVRGLTKSFPGLRALDGVDLDVDAGEIVAVVGSNGSGKSTLVKILAGIYQPDPGGTVETLTADGTPRAAQNAHEGLHFIHQDLGLIPALTTVENLDLGRSHGHGMLLPVRPKLEVPLARELIARFGAEFDVRRPVSQLSAAESAIVAIARALDSWTQPQNVLVLDEPTAALRGDEVQTLFGAVRSVADAGAGVIFISHRLDEVIELAGRVVVLRDGKKVADVHRSEIDHDSLVRLITGAGLADPVARAQRSEETILRVSGLSSATLRRVDFAVRAGEIVGVTGVLGSGREHLARAVFGALPRTSGELTLAGHGSLAADPAAAIAAGVGFVPADRHKDGAVMTLTVRENLTLPRLRTLSGRGGRLNARAERRETSEWIDRVNLRPPSSERALRLFSGGNQQKVVIAKWLRMNPRLLLLDEPTQGVDVGAKASIHQLLSDAAAQGTGVLISSSDTQELVMLCDRVLVLRDGDLVADIQREELTEQRLIGESIGIRTTLAADRASTSSVREMK